MDYIFSHSITVRLKLTPEEFNLLDEIIREHMDVDFFTEPGKHWHAFCFAYNHPIFKDCFQYLPLEDLRLIVTELDEPECDHSNPAKRNSAKSLLANLLTILENATQYQIRLNQKDNRKPRTIR